MVVSQNVKFIQIHWLTWYYGQSFVFFSLSLFLAHSFGFDFQLGWCFAVWLYHVLLKCTASCYKEPQRFHDIWLREKSERVWISKWFNAKKSRLEKTHVCRFFLGRTCNKCLQSNSFFDWLFELTGFRRKKYVTAPKSGIVFISGLKITRKSPMNWMSFIPQTIPFTFVLMWASPA